jgi:tetratricopeptide (TPR) repeat protein
MLSAPLASGQARSSTPTKVSERATLLEQAEEARKSGRSADALRLFLLAGERYQSVRAYLEAARLQSAGGNAAAALESIAEARRIAPNAEDVLSAHAQLSLATKQPLSAVLTLAALTRMHPTVAQYHYLLGVGLIGMGDMPSATESLLEAQRLEPDRPLTLAALGLVHNNRKLFAEAKTVLSRALELQPDSIEAAAALAEAEAGLGDLNTAVVHAERVLQRDASNATANLVLGMVAMERRNYAEARDRLLVAHQSDPDSTKVPYQLSLVFARMRDEDNAKKYLELYRQRMRDFEDKLRILRAGDR